MASDHLGIDTQQLLPNVLERRAKVNPEGTFAKVPKSATTYELGFRTVTNLELHDAVNQVCWLLEKCWGKGQGFPTVAYMGPTDLRYSMVVLAGIKTGYKIFLPSPRNSKAAYLSLLSRLHCTKIIATAPELPSVSMILEDYQMEKLQIPTLENLLDGRNTPQYAYDKTFDQAKNDPVFVLHTSGSTGFPKPLTYTNQWVSGAATNTCTTPPEGYRSLEKWSGSFFGIMPAFHVAGLGFTLIVSMFRGCVPVYPLPSAPPTTEGLMEAIQNTNVDFAFVAPVMIDEIGKDAAMLNVVASKLDYIYYTGGSVPKESGDAVASRIGLYQVLGSSETATFPLIRPQDDETCQDWNWVHISPKVHPEFRHRYDDLFELVLVKNSGSEAHQPVFTHFPDLQEYETRDLYSPHPSKPNLWTHRSRLDDIIVFLNGEKTNPITFEQQVSRHPEVRSALVVGQQRFEAALLIELADLKILTPEERLHTIDRIWPVVQEANLSCPRHATISKSRILLVDPAMPMSRAGKGTIQRQATWDQYSEQLDALYADIEVGSSQPLPNGFDISQQDSVSPVVHDIVADVTQWKTLDDEDDFFGRGMDSLQVLRVARELKSKLKLSSMGVKDVYANPSVSLLSQQIAQPASHTATVAENAQRTREDTLAAMLHTYEAQIDEMSTTCTQNGHDRERDAEAQVVVLTGSTGAVGSFILDELIQEKSITHVYCLNRATDSKSVQQARNTDRGLPTTFCEDKVTFLTADLSKSSLGLETTVFEDIRSSATRIIHNAWPVDFNRAISSFKPSLDGVMGLISFAQQCKLAPSILFLSSISSMINYGATSAAADQVPETIVRNFACPAAMGYGESKYLAERMLDYASQKLGQKTSVVRAGQIAGTAERPRGWSRDEWLPSLVLSSRYIGALPASLGSSGAMDEIDWIPIDLLAKILLEFTAAADPEDGDAEPRTARVVHAVNPHPTTWETMLPTVKQALQAASPAHALEIQTLPYADWLDLLRTRSIAMAGADDAVVDPKMIQQNPGVKLLDFYAGLQGEQRRTRLSTEQSVRASKSLRGLEPIREEWLVSWVKNWVSDSKY